MSKLGSRLGYDEPHPSGGNCEVTMTREQAIAWQRKCIAGQRFGPEVRAKIAGMSDEDYLLDFMAIHSAWFVKEPDA